MVQSRCLTAIAMQMLKQSVVVFSQNYLPLCRVNIKRAIVPALSLIKSHCRGRVFWIDVQANLE